jgi:hypothetical protein
LAVVNYTDAMGHYPPAFVPGPDGRPWHSWRVLILPYIEGHAIYEQYRFEEPWNGPHNRTLADRMPKIFAFPDTYTERTGVTNYLAVVGDETLWPGAKPFEGKPIDGTSQTILLAENHGLDVHWMEPRDFVFRDMPLELQHPHGISSRYRIPAVVMADDTVCSLSPTLAPATLRAMLTANGSEKLSGGPGDWEVIDDGRQRELR